MNRKDILTAVTRMREISRKRNFEQSVDLGINFTGIDFKKPENRIDVDVVLTHPTGKQGEAKVLVFAKDKAFAEQLKGKAKVILEPEIQKLKNKQVDALLNEFNLFLAEGPSILTVGKYLGQQLAPKGRMPKPITADIKSFESAVSKASTSIKVSNAKGKYMPLVQVMVGKEKDNDEKIADNVLTVYNSVLGAAGGKKQSIKSTFVKLTMGPAVKVGLSEEELKLLKEKVESKKAKKVQKEGQPQEKELKEERSKKQMPPKQIKRAQRKGGSK